MIIPYHPIDCDFYDELTLRAGRQQYCRLLYFTEIREMLTVNAVFKDLHTRPDGEFLELATGELVRLDLVVRVDKVWAPGYAAYQDFSCDC
jgi:Rho-binding antiterminator